MSTVLVSCPLFSPFVKCTFLDSALKEDLERKDTESRDLQRDLLEYKEQMKNSLEEVCWEVYFYKDNDLPSSQ